MCTICPGKFNFYVRARLAHLWLTELPWQGLGFTCRAEDKLRPLLLTYVPETLQGITPRRFLVYFWVHVQKATLSNYYEVTKIGFYVFKLRRGHDDWPFPAPNELEMTPFRKKKKKDLFCYMRKTKSVSVIFSPKCLNFLLKFKFWKFYFHLNYFCQINQLK